MGGFVRTWVSLFMLWWAEEGGFGGFVRKWVSFFMGWFVKAALTVVGVKLALSSDCRDTTTIAIGASLLVLAVAMASSSVLNWLRDLTKEWRRRR